MVEMTHKEIENLKSDKRLRNEVKVKLEEIMEIGKLKVHSVDSAETWTKMSHRVATEDAIKRFCNDLGNYNPLYRSHDHTRNSIYGGLVAPPHFLTAISPFATVACEELEIANYHVRCIEAGIEGEWFRVIREGDEFSVFETPVGIIDLTRRDTGVHFLFRTRKAYKNQRDEIVAIIIPSTLLTFPRTFGEWEELKRRPAKVRHFSEQEVEEWYRLGLEEPIRGFTPRFWEDVNVGDQLPPYHQVYSTVNYVQFLRGGGYPEWGCWRLQMERSTEKRRGWKTAVDHESGLPIFATVHFNDSSAQQHGLPNAVGVGAQMTCWLVNMITNWMGDTGFLKKINHQYRRFLWRESLVLCKGQVTKKYVEGDEHLVDLSTTLEDHNGDFQIPNGTATVVLPTRHMEKLSYLVS